MLTAKILSAVPPAPDGHRIERQIRHLDAALNRELNPQRRSFLLASYQALMWARCPDGFAPPVQMLDSI